MMRLQGRDGDGLTGVTGVVDVEGGGDDYKNRRSCCPGEGKTKRSSVPIL